MSDYAAILDMIHADDWEADPYDGYITCPCGHNIELDNPTCPDGCRNPIMEAGMI